MVASRGELHRVVGLLQLKVECTLLFVNLLDRIAFGHDRSFYRQRLYGNQDLLGDHEVGALRAETDAGVEPLHSVAAATIVSRTTNAATSVEDLQHAATAAASEQTSHQREPASRRLRAPGRLGE